jgi:hypothetical protein
MAESWLADCSGSSGLVVGWDEAQGGTARRSPTAWTTRGCHEMTTARTLGSWRRPCVA